MDLASIDKVLTTTRSVRKRLDFDRPVEPEIIMECINIALQAPTGSNSQGWHFVVVTDAAKRNRISELYRDSWYEYTKQSQPQTRSQQADPAQMARVISSAQYLADNMHRSPVLIIPCVLGRVENETVASQASLYGSILPATWSLMMALRARGLGSAWTTLHLRYEKETAELLGIPDKFTQGALLPVAYFKGDDFKPAKRLPAEEVTSWNTWGESKT